MAGQNINQYVYPNLNPKLSLESYDMSLTSDERGFNLEVVFSPYLIAQTYGKKLPINFDINNTLSAQQLVITKGVYNPSNIFVSTNYYTTENESLSCYTQHSSCDIGLTGIDNGLVSGMTGQTIYFTNGLVDDIDKFDRFYFDKRLKLFQVTGYSASNLRFSGFSDIIVYDIESVTGTTEGVYHNLYGGFYQGFYKLFGYDYNILPDRVNKGWTVEMLLKPRITASTVNSGETTLNELYPDNKNTFFFLGARAENKFYHHADGTPNCFTGYTRVTENLTGLETCACCNRTITNSRCIYVYPPRSAGGLHDSHANYSCSQCNGNIMVQTTCGCGCDKVACETCGWECQVHECATIIEVTPTPTPTPTSTSTNCILPPVCTPTCNTCDNCIDCDTCVYTGFSSIENTCETDPMYDWLSNNISLRLCGDPKNPGVGVRALRMTGDCSTTGSCDTTGITYTTGYTLVDYCSPPIYDYLLDYCKTEQPGILDLEHWIQINVVWERYSFYSSDLLCTNGGSYLTTKKVYLESLAGNTSALIAPPYTNNVKTSQEIEIVNLTEKWLIDKNYRRGRLKIYVNGYLHYTIDDFEEVIPRGLNTDKEKQVGVPFNISWGGGSQGLIENLTFTSLSALTGPYQQDPECFPTNDLTGTTFNGLETNIAIEKYFAGTFEGGISQFRFYVEPLSSSEVRHNFRLLQSKFGLLNPSCPICIGDDVICNDDPVEFVINTPTNTPTQTITPTITKTPAPTRTQTRTPKSTPTTTPTPTETPCVVKPLNLSPTPTKTIRPTPTVTKTQTKTPTVTPTITNTKDGSYYFYNLCNTTVNLVGGLEGMYTYEIYVGVNVGIVTLNYQSVNTPNRFVIEWDLSIVADTGFVGNPIYNTQLNNLGYPNVSGPGSGSISFNKNIAGPETLYIYVTSPIYPINLNFIVSCPPEPSPTPSLTKTVTKTPTVTRTVTKTETPTKTQTQTPTTTPTNTPTPSSIYYFYNLLDCNNTNNKIGRSVNIGLVGVYLVDTYTCYSIVGIELGPFYDYDLDVSTLVVDCNDLLCVLSTPTPTVTETPTYTPSTTQTPSPTPNNCLCFVIINSDLVQREVEYVDCFGNISLITIDPETIYNLCAQLLIVIDPNLGYYQNGYCTDLGEGYVCNYVATPTPTNTPTVTETPFLTPSITQTINLEITTTPSNTPTANPNNCLCFVVTNDTLSQLTVEYVDCYGNPTSTLIDTETIYNLCAQSIIDAGSMVYYQNGYCSDLGEGFGCDYVNTPTPTPTLTPTPSITQTITPTNTSTSTPTPTITPTTTPTIYYYSVNGYGCGTPCYNVGQFVVKSPIPLTIGYFYNNPENRGYTFEILSLIPETPTDYDLTNEPGYSDCTVACYPITPTPTNTVTPSITPTISQSPPAALPFVSIWSAGTSYSNTITLPYVSGGTYSGIIDWGDGTTSANTYSNRTKTYASSGVYTISIDGQVTGFNMLENNTEKDKILSVQTWGQLRGINDDNSYMFIGSSNLTLTGVTDTLNMVGVTATTSMFQNCDSLYLINGCETWNMSSVLDMSSMFNQSVNFNDPNISIWNTSNVTNMSNMFAGFSLLNPHKFNKDISSWDVSNVIDMSYMFNNNTFFNQNIGNWDTVSVITMEGMFLNATSFDNGGSSDISFWRTNSLTNIDYMFRGATSFNQPINSDGSTYWMLGGVTQMLDTFRQATSFNQDLSLWDVYNVNLFNRTFLSATTFNQDLSSWNVSNVSDASSMLDYTAINTQNYNNLLSSWKNLTLQSNVIFGVQGLGFGAGQPQSDRQYIIDTYNWTFVGDFKV